MKHQVLAVALLLAVGCAGKSSQHRGTSSGGDSGASSGGKGGSGAAGIGGTGRGGASTGGTAGDTGSDRIFLYDENNYRLTSRLSFDTIETASGVDLDVCWGDVVSDLDCNTVDPRSEIDAVSLLSFPNQSEEEVEEKLAGGQLSMTDIDGYLAYESDHASTCTRLSSFALFGTQVDVTEMYVEDPGHTFAFLFTRGSTPGVGPITMVLARPLESSENTELDAPPGCGLRELLANLVDVVPVAVRSDAPWIVDWSHLSADAQGNATLQTLDRLTLAFFADATLPELEDRIAELDRIATASYELEVSTPVEADLSEARSRADGSPFPGFERAESGIWLFELACSTCLGSMPLVLSVFEPDPRGI